VRASYVPLQTSLTFLAILVCNGQYVHVQVVSGNYVTGKRRGVVEGVDFQVAASGCWLRFAALSLALSSQSTLIAAVAMCARNSILQGCSCSEEILRLRTMGLVAAAHSCGTARAT